MATVRGTTVRYLDPRMRLLADPMQAPDVVAAEFLTTDVADVAALVKLPEALAGKPFPGEPLGCAFNIFRRADVQAGQTVAIVGIGFLGAVLTRLATDAGARVIAISRRDESLELARRFGAEVTVLEDPDQSTERRCQ